MIAAKSIRFIKFRMKANLSGQDQKRRMNSIVKKAMHKVSITQNPNFLLKCYIKKAIRKLPVSVRKWHVSDEKMTDLGTKMMLKDCHFNKNTVRYTVDINVFVPPYILRSLRKYSFILTVER